MARRKEEVLHCSVIIPVRNNKLVCVHYAIKPREISDRSFTFALMEGSPANSFCFNL